MSAPATRTSFRLDIQGLRAVAVLAVLAYHAGIPGFEGGYLGVDVFFVISGYLIGGQLVRALVGTGRIDFAGFYARRARRILPASLTVIVLTVAAALLLAPPVRAPEITTDTIWAALSAANLRFAITGTDYLAGTDPSPLQHYWSLGVEEQFYLVVPVLLIAAFLLARRRPQVLFALGVLITVASLTLCLVQGRDSSLTYFLLPSRAWELGVGVLIAALASRAAALSARAAQALAVAGFVALVVGGVVARDPAFDHPGWGTLLPVLATAAIIVAGEAAVAAPLVTRALSARPAQFIGGISFSLYLVHWPMLSIAREHLYPQQVLPLWARVAIAVLAVPVAWMLWRGIEQPFLRRRGGLQRRRRPLILAGVATAVLVGSLGAAIPALAARPLTSDRAASDQVRMLPEGTAYVPTNVHPLLASAADDTGALYNDGCQQNTSSSALVVCSFGPDDGATVVLFGDSHAGRWFPALEAAVAGTPLRLVTLTKSGCRSIETVELWPDAHNASCGAWRAAAVEWLAAHPPQLLVLANHIGSSAKPSAQVEEQWRAATLSSVARFPASTRVAILAETPEFPFSPPVCLSIHLDDAEACARPRSEAIDPAVTVGVRAGAAEAGARFVDLTDWFCNAVSCPAIIGSTLVYTDEHHLSATFSAELADVVRHEVLATLRVRTGA